mmetsp:Transcript_5457/g.10808  ORF Transcript_5457/g.10808 Transcript_5457/m.10808 type:complete len:406 (-) Transcript_5457:570-1787(-)
MYSVSSTSALPYSPSFPPGLSLPVGHKTRTKLPSFHRLKSKQTNDLALRLSVREDQIDVVERRPSGKSRHRHYGAKNGDHKPRTRAQPHLSHTHDVTLGVSSQLGVGGNRVLSLGVAHTQMAKPQSLIPRNLLLSDVGEIHSGRRVNLRSDLQNLFTDGQIKRVDEPETLTLFRSKSGSCYCLCEVHSTFPPLCPVIRHNGIEGAGLLRHHPHELQFRGRVCVPLVHAHNGRDAEFADIPDVCHQVGAPLFEHIQGLGGVHRSKDLPGHDFGCPSMQLQGTHSCNDHGSIGFQSGVPALDIAALLKPDVSSEPGLRDHDPLFSHQFQSDLVSHHGGISVGDVGERPCVNEDRGSLKCLHQSRLHRVLQKNRHRACTSKVLHSHGLSRSVTCDDHAAESVPQILEG